MLWLIMVLSPHLWQDLSSYCLARIVTVPDFVPNKSGSLKAAMWNKGNAESYATE